MTTEFLLGDNAFIGVSHMSQQKARMESLEATPENFLRVMEAAQDSGATGFTFSTHPRNLELLAYLRDQRPDLSSKMDYYPLVPYVQAYIRKSGEEGTPALMRTVLAAALGHRSSAKELVVASLSSDLTRFMGLVIEAEIAPFLKVIPEKRLKAVLLHEVPTELMVAHRMGDFLSRTDSHVKRRTGASFGLETRNLGQLQKFLDDACYSPEFIMTPFNKLGYQMAPDRHTAEIAAIKLGARSKIIATNTLASGALPFREAIDYLLRFKSSLHAIVSATTKPERASQNFRILVGSFASP